MLKGALIFAMGAAGGLAVGFMGGLGLGYGAAMQAVAREKAKEGSVVNNYTQPAQTAETT